MVIVRIDYNASKLVKYMRKVRRIESAAFLTGEAERSMRWKLEWVAVSKP